MRSRGTVWTNRTKALLWVIAAAAGCPTHANAQRLPANFGNVWISGQAGIADHLRIVVGREIVYNPGPFVLEYRTTRSSYELERPGWKEVARYVDPSIKSDNTPPRWETAFLAGGAFRAQHAIVTAALGKSWRSTTSEQSGRTDTTRTTTTTYSISPMLMTRYIGVGLVAFGDLGSVPNAQHSLAVNIQVGNLRR